VFVPLGNSILFLVSNKYYHLEFRVKSNIGEKGERWKKSDWLKEIPN